MATTNFVNQSTVIEAPWLNEVDNLVHDIFSNPSTAVEAVAALGITATIAELNTLDGITANVDELNVLDGITSTTAELNILDGVTATAAELNILDGVTATAAELNILDGVTANANELNVLDGITSTTEELNILDGVTATTAELNILDGVTATTAELNILDGVTSTATELNLLDGLTSVATLGENYFLSGQRIASAAPYIVFSETDAATDSGNWRILSDGGAFRLDAVDDAFNTYETVIQVTRIAEAVDTITFPNGTVTLSSPVINTSVSGTAIKDEDNMASDSASHLCTQQSIKAYVDAAIDTAVLESDIGTTVLAYSDQVAYKNQSNTFTKTQVISPVSALAMAVLGADTGYDSTIVFSEDDDISLQISAVSASDTAAIYKYEADGYTVASELRFYENGDVILGPGALQVTSPTINTSVGGTAIKDEDDMASDSATHLCTQQSIKAYVDNAYSATFRGCNAYSSSTQSIADGIAVPLTGFDNEEFDTDSIHDTSTNPGRFYVPSGVTKIRLHLSVRFASNATGYRRIRPKVNGSTSYAKHGYVSQNAVNGHDTEMQYTSPPIAVTGGDYFEFAVEQNSGGSLNVQSNACASMEVLG